LSELLVMGKVFVAMFCYRPIQSDDPSINLNLSDHMCFLREKMKLVISKIGRIEHVLFVTTFNTNYRYVARHLVIFGSCQDIYHWWSCSRFYSEHGVSLTLFSDK